MTRNAPANSDNDGDVSFEPRERLPRLEGNISTTSK